jgi:hypothetical protein
MAEEDANGCLAPEEKNGNQAIVSSFTNNTAVID